MHDSEDTIRTNLYIDGEEYDEYWNEWKEDIIKTIRKYEDIYGDNIYGWAYCFESDLQNEIDYYDEVNRTLKVIANENGLIIYEHFKQE